MLKIENSIPIPPMAGTKQIYPFKDMEVGDSVFIPEANHDSKIVSAAKMHFWRTGKKWTAKIVDGGIRIWRVS
jgi:hypothetical protein